MKRRAILLALLAALALPACVAGPTGAEAGGPPLIWLMADGALVEGYLGSYCWTGGPAGGVCKNNLPPEFERASSLVAGEPIRLRFAPQPHWVSLTLGNDLLGKTYFTEMMRGAETLEWDVPAAPGSYVLVVSASWERQGGVTYFFRITLS